MSLEIRYFALSLLAAFYERGSSLSCLANSSIRQGRLRQREHLLVRLMAD